MKNIIIGTAGHIDHGKTSLIRNLTNIDTDSLEEEKKRGISINLGFAFFDLPSKIRAGVIDVPGHEKFIKNMLAGSTGIDIVLLVIACDEGIKPQTREHMDILSMLNINKGVVVLTKRDLVDDEWYELIKEEVREELKDTFLKDASMIPVSSKTKEGYDELIREIDRLVDSDDYRNSNGVFRMSIDRCFSISGFGTVVTGTIISGKVSINDSLYIYPNGIETKVRNIQVYEENKNEAFAGQRCAINLANVRKEDIKRGDVLSKKDALIPSYMVDCKFYSVGKLNKNITNRQRIRFFHGANEIIGRIHILDKEEVGESSECYVQIHLEKPVVCVKDDRYVVRLYSPMMTIGGGYIINPTAKRVKGDKRKYLDEVKIREKEVGLEYLSFIFEEDDNVILSLDYVCKKYLLVLDEIKDKIDELVGDGVLVDFYDGNTRYFVSVNNLNKIYLKMEALIKEYHDKNRFKIGFLKEELKSKLNFKNIKPRVYDMLLSYFEEKGLINLTSKYVSLKDFGIKFSKQEEEVIHRIVNEYRECKFTPVRVKDLESRINYKYFNDIHDYLEESGTLYKVNQEMYLLTEDFEFAKEKIVEFIKSNGSIELNDVKEILNSNRKYSVFILEHLDELKVTFRRENVRVLF